MRSVMAVTSLLALASFLNLGYAATTLKALSKGDLLLIDLFISNPFQGDATSSYNSTLSMIVLDEDHFTEKPVHCQIEWKAGVAPPYAAQGQCENQTTRAWFPDNTFGGVKDFQLQLAHTVIDTSIGECPLCYLTKYAAVNITYPGTPNYECDTEHATCAQRVNTTTERMQGQRETELYDKYNGSGT